MLNPMLNIYIFFYGILVNIFYFKTHYIGNKEVGDSKSFFKEFIIIKGG